MLAFEPLCPKVRELREELSEAQQRLRNLERDEMHIDCQEMEVAETYEEYPLNKF